MAIDGSISSAKSKSPLTHKQIGAAKSKSLIGAGQQVSLGIKISLLELAVIRIISETTLFSSNSD